LRGHGPRRVEALLEKTHDENVQDSSRMCRIFRRIYDFPLPTIAAVNGAPLPVARALPPCAIFTLAVPKPSLATPKFARVLCRPSFPRSVMAGGHKVGRDLLLTGRLIDRRAKLMRLAWSTKWSSRHALDARARELAAQLMDNKPSSVRGRPTL